jgi:Kdo2-lipid IVA lauroyltransferase/acyltransferase
MGNEARRFGMRLAAAAKSAVGVVTSWIVTLALKAVRRTDPDRLADRAGRIMQRVGPWLREQRVGRANLAAAYPEKSAEEIETILRGVWDNLGRFAAEFAHLDRVRISDPDHPGPANIDYGPETLERFHRLRTDGKPALIFTAHLANWELPALVASAYKLDTAILYRAPNMEGVAKAIQDIRAVNMGTLIQTERNAPINLAAALERGSHVAMLVDQYFTQGIDVEFFGRPARTNPLIARLARHFDCPIHGTRIIRLGRRSFRVEVTEAIVPPRDAEGRIEVQGTMQMITSMIEAWVREHPEQWLWLHRRWR